MNFFQPAQQLLDVTGETTDSQLIIRSRLEPEVFAEVFRRHYAAIHRYINRRVGMPLADDLTQEVFLIAFRARERYRPEHVRCTPWLYGIANNVLRNHRRAEEMCLRSARVEATESQPEWPYDRELDAQVADALSRLKANDRDVLLLIAWADLTYEETATALGVPVGTVRSRLNRAREQVRRLLPARERRDPLPKNATRGTRGTNG